MPVAIRSPYDFQVLGLTVDATDEDIRAAYKKLVCFTSLTSGDSADCIIGTSVAP